MKLFFDARFTRTERHDGISRYGSCLLGAVQELVDGTEDSVVAIIHDEAQLALLPPGTRYVKLSDPLSPQELRIPARLNRLGADVVFSTMQVMGSAGRDYPLILTLHDLIYYDHPEPPHDLPAAVRGVWRLYHRAYWPQRLLLDRADAVAAVSRTTAGLMEKHRLTRRPVAVISNAAEPPAGPVVRGPGHDAHTLVYMGAFLPYKNVETLIAALAHLPGYTLHLCSKVAPEREAELAESIPEGATVVFHHGISDEDYRALLDSATALVTASRAEGFGLPVVEAMARGCPVAVSDLPIFRELGGEVPAYFDPEEPSSVAEAVRSLEVPGAWRAAAAAGPPRAAEFSWRRSAEALLGLARELHDARARPQSD